MTGPELVAFIERRCNDMVATARAKNADYTAGDPDAFANFRAVELLGIATVEAGILTRMTDKFMRVKGLTAGGTAQVKTESLADTLIDIANYALILAAYVESK